MLFNEPKLLKFLYAGSQRGRGARFSALQRAEIAEISSGGRAASASRTSFSALQRAEIAEIALPTVICSVSTGFSALQRAEIAEIGGAHCGDVARQCAFQCSSTSRNC